MEVIAFPGLLRVACDGSSRSISPWISDDDDNGTDPLGPSSSTIDRSGVTDPAPAGVYQGGWQSDDSGVSISYMITGLKPGSTYTVRVHLCAETGSSGKYVQTVYVSGLTSQSVSSVDPEDDPGVNVARVVSFSAQPQANGTLTILCTPATDKSAQMCGFEVIPPGPVVEPLVTTTTRFIGEGVINGFAELALSKPVADGVVARVLSANRMKTLRYQASATVGVEPAVGGGYWVDGAEELGDFLPVPWQANPPDAYLTIPGVTESQITHPHVVYVPGGWMGFEWWMVATPYVDGDDQMENPCIWQSHDGLTWTVPAGVTNPLVASPGDPDYNSDTHVGWEPDGRMRITFREHIVSESEPSNMKVMYSEDGVTWTTPVIFINNGVGSVDASPVVEWVGNTVHYFAVKYASGVTTLVHRSGGSLLTLGAAVTCTLPSTRLGPECVLWHIDIVRIKNLWVCVAAVGNAPAIEGQELLLWYSVDGNTWTGPGLSMCGQSGNNEAWHEGNYKSCAVWNCNPPRLYYTGTQFIDDVVKHRVGVTTLRSPLVVPTPTEAEVIAGIGLKGKWIFADVVDRAANGASPGAPSSHSGTNYTVDIGQFGILDESAALGGMRLARTGSVASRMLFDVGRSPVFAGVTQDGGITGWALVLSFVDADNWYYLAFDETGQLYFNISRSGVVTQVKAGAVERTSPERVAVRYQGTYSIEVFYNDRRVCTLQPKAPRPVGTKIGLYSNSAAARFTNFWAQWERL